MILYIGGNMKLTNKHNLPQSIVNALHRPSYSKEGAHLSVTQLINAPKIVALRARFEDEIETDASDQIWSLFGNAIHQVLEHGKDASHVVEQRLHAEIDGWHISGAIDLQIINPDGTVSIRDYKTTSAWSVMSEKLEWEHQLNVYAWLVNRVHGVEVRDLGIVAIIRDWNRRDAAAKESYPQAPIKELPIKLWDKDRIESYISDRISRHSAMEFAIESNDDLPECSPDEMWERQTVFAVKKKGGVRAKAIYQDESEAKKVIESLGKDFELEVRPGERVRCKNFCQVNQFCKQWRDHGSVE